MLKLLSLLALRIAAAGGVLGGAAGAVWAAVSRRIVPCDEPLDRLVHEDPKELDTSELATTPMDQFGVMGETTLDIDPTQWRLELDGKVSNPGVYRYEELLDQPVIERNVLLICPGFFAYNGLWKGVSAASLISKAEPAADASRAIFHGSVGLRHKKRRFDLTDVTDDTVFLAYGVNGVFLPKRHGFPLRLVARDRKGRDWVKYINRIEIA